MAQEITKENLQSLIDSGKPVVIDFWAEWCGPCRAIAPTIEALATAFEGQAIVGKCDVDANNSIASEYGVRNIPTLVFIKDGQVVDRQVGVAQQSVLEAKIKALL